ncbi:hypothetical protein AAC387_Pa06g2361 [Persea americana]
MEMVLGSEEKSKGCCAGWKEIRKMEVCAWAWRNGKMGLNCDGCWLREEDEVGCWLWRRRRGACMGLEKRGWSSRGGDGR